MKERDLNECYQEAIVDNIDEIEDFVRLYELQSRAIAKAERRKKDRAYLIQAQKKREKSREYIETLDVSDKNPVRDYLQTFKNIV